VSDGGLDTRVRDQSHDDDFVNVVLLELHIQIRVGKAAGTPMLRGDDIARLRFGTQKNRLQGRSSFVVSGGVFYVDGLAIEPSTEI